MADHQSAAALKLAAVLESAVTEALADGATTAEVLRNIGNFIGYSAANNCPDMRTMERTLAFVEEAIVEAAVATWNKQHPPSLDKVAGNA